MQTVPQVPFFPPPIPAANLPPFAVIFPPYIQIMPPVSPLLTPIPAPPYPPLASMVPPFMLRMDCAPTAIPALMLSLTLSFSAETLIVPGPSFCPANRRIHALLQRTPVEMMSA